MTVITGQTEGQTEVPSRTHRRFMVPLAFLGLGVYRAWIEIVFVGSWVAFPAVQFTGRDLFDGVAIAVWLLCALFARRLGPFFNKRWVYVVSGVALTLATIGMFSGLLFEELAPAVGPFSAALGGVGIALIILLWSELFGCLNPLRVALYYSAAIIAGALVLYVYRGFYLPWLFAMTALLPFVSLVMAHKGFGVLPPEEQPHKAWVAFKVPWKAVALMALYAFAYGVLETPLYAGAFGPHSAPGVLLVALLVFVGVVAQGGRFDFTVIYRVALPLMIVALLLIPALGFTSDTISSLCVSGGYTAVSILTMIICASICYRYGVSALWLFGIERAVRSIAMFCGRQVAALEGVQIAGVSGEVVVAGIAVLAVVMGTFVLMSERDLASRWGAVVRSDVQPLGEVAHKQALADRCTEVAREYGLTAREGEVLLLLGQRKTAGIIERELFIAHGTAKAHIRHIYAKLDIHTREELFEMLGVTSGEVAEGSAE